MRTDLRLFDAAFRQEIRDLLGPDVSDISVRRLQMSAKTELSIRWTDISNNEHVVDLDDLRNTDRCAPCSGTGNIFIPASAFNASSVVACSYCGGAGRTRKKTPITEPCPHCLGQVTRVWTLVCPATAPAGWSSPAHP